MKTVMATLAAATLSCLLIGGCAVKSNPAQTKVYTPYGEYKNHCPPGQRKKGNCY